MTVTRVFVAAPTPMMRAGLRALLQSSELEVAGEAASLEDAGGQVAGVDVLVVAGEEPGERELRALLEASENAPAVVVLSGNERPALVLRTLPVRGWAIVPPDAPSEELRAAVEAAGQGFVVMSPPVASRLLASPQRVASLEAGAQPLEEPLTARELEVLGLLSHGLSNKQIARSLQISEHTVKFHVSALYTKLNASSRTEAVNRGARLGLISF